ncbi:MAG: hypothetical protein V1816_25065 [Pseudomonadota bacterium]
MEIAREAWLVRAEVPARGDEIYFDIPAWTPLDETARETVHPGDMG